MKRILSKSFIVLPNSLFYNIKPLKDFDKIFVVEEPLFFGLERQYNINKIKLAYMRACLRYYYDYLQKNYINVHYIEHDNVKDYSFVHGECVTFYDPVDFDFDEKMTRLKIDYVKLETKLFFNTNEQIRGYFESKKDSKRFIQGQFYTWMKQKLNVLVNVKSKDEENRKPLPKNHTFTFSKVRFDKGVVEKYYKEAKEWVENHPTYKNNIGSADKLHFYPINEEGAKEQFTDFLETRVKNFGPYEDAIDKKQVVLFHSFISASLNTGLLLVEWVLDRLMSHLNIPMNSLEGYVRQLIGWREYQRGLYVYFYKDLRSANHFGNSRRLNWSVWYGEKSTGMEILDNEIKKAMLYGYSHHIPRLCIFLNIFVLMQVRLEDVVKWFSEVVCMDAYPWVMYSNIVSMGYFDTRFMQKPYITSSAYLLKMSDYSKGQWCDVWTALFYHFLSSNKDRLTAGAMVYLRNLQYHEKKSVQEKNQVSSTALSFINKVCID
jgi:deoxyribodipyrimidine photolyase-related protein